MDKTEDGIIKSRLIDLRTGRVTGQEHKDADTGEIIWSVNVVDDKGNFREYNFQKAFLKNCLWSRLENNDRTEKILQNNSTSV